MVCGLSPLELELPIPWTALHFRRGPQQKRSPGSPILSPQYWSALPSLCRVHWMVQLSTANRQTSILHMVRLLPGQAIMHKNVHRVSIRDRNLVHNSKSVGWTKRLDLYIAFSWTFSHNWRWEQRTEASPGYSDCSITGLTLPPPHSFSLYLNWRSLLCTNYWSSIPYCTTSTDCP